MKEEMTVRDVDYRKLEEFKQICYLEKELDLITKTVLIEPELIFKRELEQLLEALNEMHEMCQQTRGNLRMTKIMLNAIDDINT